MAISKITGAGLTTTDSITASQLAPDSVGHSELNDATGITTTHHKVPSFADADARDAAISSPANGMIIYNTAADALQQYNGSWSTIIPAPKINSISGFLNEDTDSTLTIFGSSFNSTSAVKIYDAAAGGSQVGSNATTTFNSATKLTAVFGGSGAPVAGDAVYIEVDNSGVSTRFATAITLNQDPVVTHAGATGTNANTTTHLGTYSGGVSFVDEDTQLLLQFDRGGGTDIEDSSNIGGDGHKVTASGNAVIKASPFGDGKSAMFFDGSDDELATGTSTDFDIAKTSTFTIELWLNRTVADGSQGYTRVIARDGSVGGWALTYHSNGNYLEFGSDQGGTIIQSNYTTVVNRWYHVAVVGDGTNVKLYINGIERDSKTPATLSTWTNASTTGVTIGRRCDNSVEFGGYLDEIRIVFGTAVYTSNFTVPTTRLTEITNTKLLIHSNLSNGGSSYNTFTDSSTTGTTHSITASGAFHSTLYNVAENTVTLPAMTWPASGKEFASYGAYFDGNGDYFTIPDHADFDFGTGDFTIDLWFNRKVSASQGGTIQNMLINSGANDAAGFSLVAGNSVGDTVNFGHSVWTTVLEGTTDIVDGTWYHVAVVRNSGVSKLYVNGIEEDTVADTKDYTGFSCTLGWHGGYNGSTRDYNGYIDVVRISKGTAHWTANFTPPTKVYDGAENSATLPTITLTGTTTPALAADEDIEFTSVANTTKASGVQHLTDTNIGATLTNLTGGDKSKATLTGALTSAVSTTHSNMAVKAQVRKTLGDAAYANAARTVTFSGSTTTAGLAPAMPVSGTGIPAGTTITTVDSSTQITLSANPTGGTLTGQSLVFLDLTRITHINGSDTLDNTDAMYTLATGASTSKVLFNARRYTGNEVGLREITGFGFQPDMVWIKSRATTDWAGLADSVRPSTNFFFPSETYANTDAGNYITAFLSDGIRLGAAGTGNSNVANNINGNNYKLIAWAWKAGGKPSGILAHDSQYAFGAGSNYNGLTTGAGTISNSATGVSGATSITQSVNQTSGFSITKYTGASGTGAIPHNLGATPAFIIIKRLATEAWHCWHQNLTATTGYHIQLESNGAESAQNTSGSNVFNPAPTSTLIGLGDNSGVYHTEAYMCYAWKVVAGVSAFGSYTGNAGSLTVTFSPADTFIPRMLIIKNRDNGGGWLMYDQLRGFGTSGNTDGNSFAADTSAVEVTNQKGITVGAGTFTFNTSESSLNQNGSVFIYCAFA